MVITPTPSTNLLGDQPEHWTDKEALADKIKSEAHRNERRTIATASSVRSDPDDH
jgi:hypothetical protein